MLRKCTRNTHAAGAPSAECTESIHFMHASEGFFFCKIAATIPVSHRGPCLTLQLPLLRISEDRICTAQVTGTDFWNFEGNTGGGGTDEKFISVAPTMVSTKGLFAASYGELVAAAHAKGGEKHKSGRRQSERECARELLDKSPSPAL